MVRQIGARRLEKPAAKAETLELRGQIKLENFTTMRQRGDAIAAIAGVTAYGIGEIKHQQTRSAGDGRIPPLRTPTRDHAFEFAPGDQAAISVSPGDVVDGCDVPGVDAACPSDGDDCFIHCAILDFPYLNRNRKIAVGCGIGDFVKSAAPRAAAHHPEGGA